MKLCGVIVTLYFCFALTSLPVSSQQPRAQDPRSINTIRIDTDLIMIDVTACPYQKLHPCLFFLRLARWSAILFPHPIDW
jgi:hypothetical protein